MLRLLAIAPGDGWAFVEREGKVLLVRPPYRHDDLAEVQESVVEKAVAKFGFRAAKKEFQDWASLIRYLEEQLLGTRKALGLPEPNLESVREFVRQAPHDVVESYLARVRSELIPGQEWDAALDLLNTLLGSDVVWKDRQLHSQVLELLDKCRGGRAVREGDMQTLLDESELRACCPRAADRYGARTLADYVRGRSRPGAMTPMCA